MRKIEYLQYIWLVVCKRKRLIAAVGLTTFASVLFFGYLVTPVWEGTTLLLVERTSKQNLSLFRDVSLPVGQAGTEEDAALGLIPLLTGENMAYDVVRKFGLDKLAREKRTNPPTMRDVIKNLIVDIIYTPVYLIWGREEKNWVDEAAEDFVEDWIDIEEEEEGTGVINLTVYGESPEQATKLANGMAALLVERTQSFNRDSAVGVFDYVAAQAREGEARLKKAEADLARYQTRSGVYSVEDDRRLLALKVDQLRTDLLTVRRLHEENTTNLTEVTRELGSQPERQMLSASIARNPVITDIEKALVDLKVRLAALLVEKSPDHPDVKIVEAEIERNQEQILSAIQTVIQSQTEVINPIHQDLLSRAVNLRVESAMVTTRERELSRSIRDLEAQRRDLPLKEMELARLQRVLEINQSVYDSLKTRLEHLAMERESVANEYNIRVLDRAYVPAGRDQDWPLWWLNILAGLFLGLVFGVGGAFAVEYWNEPILSGSDVEQVLALPYLGQFPELGKRDF